MRVRVAGLRSFIPLSLLIVLTLPASAVASDSEARRLFVEAEMLRRSDVCDVGQKGDALSPLAKVLAWNFLESHAKARQLRPLLPALASVEDLDADAKADLVKCLQKWEKAAEIEQEILREHSGTAVAFDLAKERRLSPRDVSNIIASVEASGDMDESGYSESQREDLNRLIEEQDSEAQRAKDAYDALSNAEPETLSKSQINAIREQLASCWAPPIGAREKDVEVRLKVKLERDGSVKSAELLSRRRMDESLWIGFE
jgi:DNA-binding MarR family transcriptional regulator